MHFGQTERPLTPRSLIQRYMTRPETMVGLSIRDVLAKFYWRDSRWKSRNDSTDVVVRVFFPRFSPNPDGDVYADFCRTKILLHHPFRDLNTVRGDNEESWSKCFTRCRTASHDHPNDSLRSWEEEHVVKTRRMMKMTWLYCAL
jgi:hypothetical protein